MCVRGASALADILTGAPSVKAFVVWEPVLGTDKGPPGPDVALRDDPRVHRYWDPGLALSQRILADLPPRPDCFPGKDDPHPTVWDVAFVFPAGVRWEDKLPPPAYCGRPVARVAGELKAAVASPR
jgi:hypothetical protein